MIDKSKRCAVGLQEGNDDEKSAINRSDGAQVLSSTNSLGAFRRSDAGLEARDA